MLVDERTWAIRYLIVDTSNWWGGHHVLVAPQWIEAVSWPDAKVSVGPDSPGRQGRSSVRLGRRTSIVEQEQAMYEHYGHPGYWTTEAIRAEKLAFHP